MSYKHKKNQHTNGDTSGVCLKCRQMYPSSDLTVHHVIPKLHINNIRDILNLKDSTSINSVQHYVVLCRNCHVDIHKVYNLYDPTKRLKQEYGFKCNLNKNTLRFISRLGEISKDISKMYLDDCIYYRQLYNYFMEDKIK